MDKVVIVMPTYNESENIALMIHELFTDYFPKIKDADMHLLVVDDYSPDGTGDVVRNLAKHHKNLHLLQKKKEGLGWAYVRGMQYAMDKLHADAVLEMDGDFQHPPRFVKPMVEAYLDGADYVIGSRYVPGGSIPKEWALYRKFWSYFGNLYARIVLTNFKIHDMTTGFRLTKVKGVLDQIKLDKLMELQRFAYKLDLLYKTVKLAKKVVEVPLQFEPRTKEKSKFNMKEAIASYKVVTILGIKDKIRFIKFGTVGFVGYLVNAITLELFSRGSIASSLANTFVSTRGSALGILSEPSAWAASLATEMAIISNFTFNNIWTFSEVKITKPLKIIMKFLEFNLTSLGAVVIQFLVIGGAVMFFGDTRLVRQLALIAGMPLVLTFNYVMYNLVIWKTWKLPWAKKK